MNQTKQVWIALTLITSSSLANPTCPTDHLPASQWMRIRGHDFALPDAADVQRAALALLPCLDDPDPRVRDEIAYEALAFWMRGRQMSTATAREVLQRLSERLKTRDDTGFGRPFAALALAEVARMDRIEPFLTPEEFEQLVDDASRYLSSVRDYRGFDEHEGWRHAVAHGADVLMQLAMNPRASKHALDSILAATASQVAPPVTHFYVYGESARLVRPVLFVAQRRTHSPAEWTAWLNAIAAPAPFQDWSETLRSQSGLAKRHNTLAFFNALFVAVEQSNDEGLKSHVLPPLASAMSKL